MASLNAMSAVAFVNLLGGVYEHSPWVAEQAVTQRPFKDAQSLENCMRGIVESSDRDRKLALLQAHPQFAGKEAQAGMLTVESTAEQGRLSLNRLPTEQFKRMQAINDHYMQRFGFPGIVAVRLHQSVDSVFAELERRRDNDIETEITEAIGQVYHIVHFRLVDLISA
jgi:2-oxo-4-hydroxy-4-carboxy-5-ureidoimidazoline decarboxylase